MKARPESETAPFELIEQAFHLVRTAPVSAWAAYYLGALPFVLAALYFWSDMARSAFAEQRLVPGALALTGLFVWMKAWQSVYCRHLLARLCGDEPPTWRVRPFLQTAAFQAIVQPAGLFLFPLAALLMIPLGWVYAFFSAATVVHGNANASLRESLARCWRQAVIWPLQNHYLLSLMVLFGLFVFFNILSAVLGVPYLIKMLLGIESVFTRSPWAALNSTLLAAQIALTYLCLDPVLKAAYVLRYFQSESLRTGQDLRTELSSLRPPLRAPASLAALVVLLVFTAPGHGAEGSGTARSGIFDTTDGGFLAAAGGPTGESAPLSPDLLERSIERTLQRREFSWRLPPDTKGAGANADNSWLARLARQIESGMKAAGRWVEDVVKWIFDTLFSRNRPGAAGGTGWADAMEIAFILIIALLLGVILWMLLRLWQHRPQLGIALSEAPAAAPNLAAEDVSADELPEDGWVRLARELLSRGDVRLALRAFYLASLAHLGERRLIILARFKSNRDYERELQRRAHALGSLPGLFADNLTMFERAWYGSHVVTTIEVDQFAANLERMKALAPPAT